MAGLGPERRRGPAADRARLQARNQHLGYSELDRYNIRRNVRINTIDRPISIPMASQRRSSARPCKSTTSRASEWSSSPNASSAWTTRASFLRFRRQHAMTATSLTAWVCPASTSSMRLMRACSDWARISTCYRFIDWTGRRRARRS